MAPTAAGTRGTWSSLQKNRNHVSHPEADGELRVFGQFSL
jgi:hypothetical protein